MNMDSKKAKSRSASSKKRKKPQKENWLSRNSFWVMCAAILFVGVSIFIGLFGIRGYDGNDAWIYVPPQATNQSVRDSLKSKLGMVGGNRTYLLWRLQGGDVATARGMYKVQQGESSLSLSRRLKTGRQTPIDVSFIGARSLDKIARRIAKQMEFSDTVFLAACDSILYRAGFTHEEYLAAFLPDTYQFYITDRADKVVERLLDYRNRFWNEERRAKATALHLDPVGVATIASIVEEETSKIDERPMIARLYLNRLSKNMKLQADPTVKFANGDFAMRRIGGESLRINSPYNTYVVNGLPPGPIRMADKQTINGVLNAPRHDYLYMCAKSDFSGYHDFATTYDEHMNNAKRYHQELNKRNIH